MTTDLEIIGPRTFIRLENEDGGLVYVGHRLGSKEAQQLAASIAQGPRQSPFSSTQGESQGGAGSVESREETPPQQPRPVTPLGDDLRRAAEAMLSVVESLIHCPPEGRQLLQPALVISMTRLDRALRGD